MPIYTLGGIAMFMYLCYLDLPSGNNHVSFGNPGIPKNKCKPGVNNKLVDLM